MSTLCRKYTYTPTLSLLTLDLLRSSFLHKQQLTHTSSPSLSLPPPSIRRIIDPSSLRGLCISSSSLAGRSVAKKYLSTTAAKRPMMTTTPLSLTGGSWSTSSTSHFLNPYQQQQRGIRSVGKTQGNQQQQEEENKGHRGKRGIDKHMCFPMYCTMSLDIHANTNITCYDA